MSVSDKWHAAVLREEQREKRKRGYDVTRLEPRPCSAPEALARLHSMINVEMPYILGTGGYHPPPALDTPWTPGLLDPRKPADYPGNVVDGCDCAGTMWARKIPRHRLGFNKGPHCVVAEVDIEDDINSNSAIGDSLDAQDLFVPVPYGALIVPGDVLVYPSIRLRGADGDLLRGSDGKPLTWIGHWQNVAANPKNVLVGQGFSQLAVIQCFGPNGRKPAIMLTDGHMMDQHDATWPKPDHRTRVLRWVS